MATVQCLVEMSCSEDWKPQLTSARGNIAPINTFLSSLPDLLKSSSEAIPECQKSCLATRRLESVESRVNNVRCMKASYSICDIYFLPDMKRSIEVCIKM